MLNARAALIGLLLLFLFNMKLAVKNFWLALLAVGFVTCKSGEPSATDDPQPPVGQPNIIFLLADDLRFDGLGIAGNPVLNTPNLDGLATNGVYFSNAFVTTSICAVSRASILSGQYASRHGIWGFAKNFSATQLAQTYPALLRQAGYTTGFIGKYGVGTPDTNVVSLFDYWEGFAGQGTYNQTTASGRPIHLTKKIEGQAVEFLQQQAGSTQPFCLSVSFKAPHVEGDPGYFLPDAAYSNLYQGATIEEPLAAAKEYFNYFPDNFTQNNVARNRWHNRFATPEMFQESVKKYYRLIHGIDVAVGAITETLRTTGQLKNTVIIFTSDNGFYLGEYGFAGKWYGSDASIRVPLLVYDGRSEAVRGVTAEQMVLNIDMAPTILGLAGLEAPAAMQGQNIMPLAQNSSQQIRSEFFYEHQWQSSPAYYIPSTQGVVTQDYKYMRYFLNENYNQPLFEELYDRERDTHEVTNRMDDPDYTQARQVMLKKWEEMREGVR